MVRRRTSLFRRLRRGSRRGAALAWGAFLIVALVLVLLMAWQRDRDALRLAEIDRERGRIWGMTCTALQRAVQSRLVTTARTVTPAELKGWSLLPGGLGSVERAGGVVATSAYGVVMAGGVPLAACSLSGPELAFRAPALRAGSVMGGLDLVGVVGGDATAMHDRLAAVEAVLGPLPAGSMFMTADFGIRHAADRLHRREVGGRPELVRMETDFVFGPNTGIGQDLLPAGEIVDGVAVVPGQDCRNAALPDERRCFDMLNAGSVTGIDAGANGSSRFQGLRAEIGGNVTVGRPGQPGSMTFVNDKSRIGFSCRCGVPVRRRRKPRTGLQHSAIAECRRSDVVAGLGERWRTVQLRGRLEAGGRLTARGQARAGTLAIDGDLGADSGSFTSVTTGGCDEGCDPTTLGGG